MAPPDFYGRYREFDDVGKEEEPNTRDDGRSRTRVYLGLHFPRLFVSAI